MDFSIYFAVVIVYIVGYLTGYQTSGREMFNIFKNIMRENPEDKMKEWYDVIKDKKPSIFGD